MIRHFVYKEMVETLLGPKFLITFAISIVLILISVYSGYRLYDEEVRWFVNAKSQNIQRLENLGSYGSLRDEGTKVLREPSRMSIFVKGVDSAVGRSAMVSRDPNTVLRDSRFGLNPIFAVFGELDLAFIVKMILSLFALLFSYNAVSGERETGTLKQVFSNSIGRASFIIGKSIGGLITLLLTLLLPLIIALLMLMTVFNVNFSGEEWIRIGLMTLTFVFYLTVFYLLGMLMSAVTRQTAVSFLLCLFVWVLSVAVMPRLAVELASQISPAPSIDEVEARRTALRRTYYGEVQSKLETALNELFKTSDPTQADARRVRDEIDRKARETIEDEDNKILSDYRLQQVRLLNTSEVLARISPTSSATFALNRIAYTDAGLRERYLDAITNYKQSFTNYAEEKVKENPDLSSGGISTSVSVSDDDDTGRKVSVKVRTPSTLIDVGGLPQFSLRHESLQESLAAALPDFAVLLFEIILFFISAFVFFMRYDVR